MFSFFALLGVLMIVLVIAPFYFFPGQMEDYGTYLTGLAAIGAALKFVAPYLVILFYRKRYANEKIWKVFLDISEPDEKGHVLETAWIGGVISYFRRNDESLTMNTPWYNNLPFLSDEVYAGLGTTKMTGAKENKLFDEIRELLFHAAHLVAMNSTPNRPMVKEDKYKELHETFKRLVTKADEMNSLIVAVPIPAKKIIEGDEFFQSFFKKLP